MKKRFSKILGVAVTLAMLSSLLVGVAPVAAVSAPSVSSSSLVISTNATYTMTFQLSQALTSGAAAATLTTGLAGTNAITYVADTPGVAGNAITIEYTEAAPGSALIVSVAGTAISVELADVASVITSTAAQVVAAINADAVALALVDASSTDIGLMAAIVPAALAGGTADSISVTFPTGFNVVGATAQIAATSGIGTAAFALASATTTVALQVVTVAIPATVNPQGAIGVGATVQLVIGAAAATNVTNSAAPGTYALSVVTSNEATAATSAAFTLTVPVIPAVSGIVQGFNISGVKLYENTGNNAISNALPNKVPGVVRIVVGPGTYDENLVALVIPAGVTVVSSAGAATTIISDADASGGGGTVVISGTIAAPAVLDGFTVTGGVAATDMVTVQNCVLSNAAGAALTFAGAGITTALAPAKSIGNTISAAPAVGAGGRTGLAVAAVAAFVASTNDIINIAATTATLVSPGTAITVGATATITVTGATVKGASGTGINNAGTATIASSSFSTLSPALSIGAATATTTVSTSTFDACGFASTTVPMAAINITTAAPASLSISSSTISNSPEAILRTAAVAGISAANIFVNFNTLTGNVLSFVNGDTTVTNFIDASNNWWGVSTGPAVASTGNVYTTPYLSAQVTNQMLAPAVAAGTTTSWQTTAGVDIIISGLATNTIAAAKYTSNPAGTVVPANVVVTTYFDVYRRGAVAAVGDSVTVRFYGIKSNAATVYAFSNTQGVWVLANGQAVDQFRGCVTVTITSTSTPNVSNLTGLAFALVEPSAVVLPPDAPEVLTPKFGDMAAAIQPTFTWTAPATSTSYEFVLAEEIGQDNKFAIIDYSATTTINGHVARESLKYGTVYNWRVRAVSAAGSSDWAEGFFTTATEPEPAPEPVPPVKIIQQDAPPAPEIILQVPPTEAPVNVIPGYLLWTVVAVGALLIIAVVVLIVRTRRIA